MRHELELLNVKCGGCGNSILRAVGAIPGVSDPRLDVESGHISLDAPESARTAVAQALARLGYPERGSVEGMAALAASAKSFVSCAVGRFGPDETKRGDRDGDS
ncbi:MAG: heavy-metal-associated domain-containing protein [Aquimonas sp.]|nr:heavy-metal-associated domain-containing protein [Aquimonas sp.]